VSFAFVSALLIKIRVLLEKLTGFQIVKKLPTFYVTRSIITVFTRSRHLHLSRASSIQSITPHPTSWKSILILSSNLCLGLPQVSPPNPVYASPLSHTRYLHCASYSSRFYHPNSIGWEVQIIKLLIDKCVRVTTAWHVLRLRKEEQPPILRVAANILNKQSQYSYILYCVCFNLYCGGFIFCNVWVYVWVL